MIFIKFNIFNYNTLKNIKIEIKININKIIYLIKNIKLFIIYFPVII